jgi:hypothetical protein
MFDPQELELVAVMVEDRWRKFLLEKTGLPFRVKFQRDGVLVFRLTPKDMERVWPGGQAAVEAWLTGEDAKVA